MNERIKELAEQAGIAYSDRYDEFSSSNTEGVTLEGMERFAELILADEHTRVKQEINKRLIEMYDRGAADALKALADSVKEVMNK